MSFPIRRCLPALLCGVVLSSPGLTLGASAVRQPEAAAKPGLSTRQPAFAFDEAFGKLPLAFEQNRGQFDPAVRFVGRGPGYTVGVYDDRVVMLLPKAEAPPVRLRILEPFVPPAALRGPGRAGLGFGQGAWEPPAPPPLPERIPLTMRFDGGRPARSFTSSQPLPGKMNYFKGNDPSKWVTKVPTTRRVTANGVYPGIDVAFYGNPHQLEYDFIVEPGVDPGVIRMAFEGHDGLELQANGDLRLATAAGPFTVKRPHVYEEIAGVRTPLESSFRMLADGRVGFRVESRRREARLVIDPVFEFWLPFGQISFTGVGFDADGNIVAGGTAGSTFPTTLGSYQASLSGGYDFAAMKLTPDGANLLYGTFVGGVDSDYVLSADVDATGRIVLGGTTESNDFPGGVTATGSGLAAVAKVAPDGATLVFSSATFEGQYRAVAAGSGGETYVAGHSFDGSGFAFVTALDGTGADAASVILDSLVNVWGLTVDPGDGSVWAVGFLGTSDASVLPQVNPIQMPPGADSSHQAFILKYSAGLAAQLAGTPYGGSSGESIQAVAVDGAGRPVFLGTTSSLDFPQVGGLGVAGSSQTDAFIGRLNQAGTSVQLSTTLGIRLGGFGSFRPRGLAVDTSNQIYATFDLQETPLAFPLVDEIWGFEVPESFLDSRYVAGLTVVSAAGDTILFSTALHPFFTTPSEGSPFVAVAPNGDVVLAGDGDGSFVGFLGKIVSGSTAASVVATVDSTIVSDSQFDQGLLTVEITNNGPSTSFLTRLYLLSTNLFITSTFTGPPGLECGSEFVGENFCRIPGMGSGETISITSEIQGQLPGSATIDVLLLPSGTDPDRSDNTATLQLTVVTGEADLGVTGTSLPSPPAVGQTLTYSLTVNNAGPDEAQQTTLTGTLPAHVLRETITSSVGTCAFTPAGFACELGTVAAGAAPTVDVVLRPLQAGPVSSTISVTGLALDNNLANNELTLFDTSVSTGATDLSLTLADAPDPLTVGGTVTYTATVSSAGPDDAPNATVVLTLDPTVIAGVPVPSQGACAGTGPFTCSLGTVPSGGTALVLLSAATTAANEALPASAVVYSDASDDPPGNNLASATTRVALPGADLKLQMVRTPARVLTGEEVVFTLTVTNLGLDPASGVQVVSTLGGDDISLIVADTTQGSCTFTNPVTCSLGSLAFGDAVTISIVGIKSTPGTLSNDAEVSATTNDPVAGNNTASASATVNARMADVSVVTTVAPTTAFIGGTATYTITVTNAGPQDASDVRLTHDLDDLQVFLSGSPGCAGGQQTECLIGPLGQGESRVFTIVVALQASGTAQGTSTVTATEVDPNVTNNSSTATLQVVESADLSVTNVDSPDPVDAGSVIAYVVRVQNGGPTPATDVALSAALDTTTTPLSAIPSAGACTLGQTVTCTLGSIAAGATVSVEIRVTATTPGTVTSVATVASPVPDPSPANNTATATTTVRPVADLSITASDEVDPILVGGNVAYPVTVTNLGPFTATNAGLRLELPPGTAAVSLSPGSCTVSGGAVTCALGPLAVGASASARIVLSASQAGVLTSLFRTTSADSDPAPANNVAAVRTSVDAPGGDLSILKAHTPAKLTLGGTGRFTFTVRRISSQAVTTPLKLASVANSRFGTDLTLDGSRMTSTRAKLLSTSSFGPGGTSGRPIAITDLSATLTPEVLAAFDVFFVGYLNDDNAKKLSAAELAAFTAFVNDGGTVIATCDDFNYDAVCNAFGYFVLSTLPPTAPITPTVDGQTHPIFQGPFGAVTQYSGFQTVGYFASPAPGVSILARAPDGKPLLMTRRLGQGQVIFMSDVDHIAGALTPGSGIGSDNDRLLGNLLAYAGRTGTPVVTDLLPAGLTFASAAGASCLADGALVTCVLPALATGAVSTFTVDVNVGAGAFARLSNVGRLATPGDTNPANDASTDIVDVIGGAAGPKGDLDLNGKVDVFDLVILANYLVGNFQEGTPPFVATALTADLNGDGRVDVFDLVLLAGCIVAGGGC